jgi:hypothetical protein
LGARAGGVGSTLAPPPRGDVHGAFETIDPPGR